MIAFIRERRARAGQHLSLDDLYNRVNDEGIEYVEFYDEALDRLTDEGVVTIEGLEMVLTDEGERRVYAK
jgi:hypothetical protein